MEISCISLAFSAATKHCARQSSSFGSRGAQSPPYHNLEQQLFCLLTASPGSFHIGAQPNFSTQALSFSHHSDGDQHKLRSHMQDYVVPSLFPWWQALSSGISDLPTAAAEHRSAATPTSAAAYIGSGNGRARFSYRHPGNTASTTKHSCQRRIHPAATTSKTAPDKGPRGGMYDSNDCDGTNMF